VVAYTVLLRPREIGMDKLKIDWGIRAKRFEERIRNREIERGKWNSDGEKKKKEVGKICMSWKERDAMQRTGRRARIGREVRNTVK